ncbi:MAG: hypothetical protein AB8I08_33070 [Sandaracinaceae bacterium]
MTLALTAMACLGTVTLARVPEAHAQSAQDQAAAAEAYDRATAAYVSRDYERAGALFETAHRLAPAAAALTQAVRAHQRAGNTLRAASLALQLRDLYPDDTAGQRAARGALRDSRANLLQVDVQCDGCTVQVDGGLVSHPSFFVEPGTPHTVVAGFDTGELSETVEGRAGQVETLSFEAPALPPEPLDPPDDPEDPVGTGSDPEPLVETQPAESGGIPLYVGLIGVGVTAALGGVLVWSGVDTLDGVPAYEANPTTEALADGRSREERTNWLIAATAVAGVATAVLFIFTDFDGDDGEEPGVEATLDVGPTGGTLGLRGRY